MAIYTVDPFQDEDKVNECKWCGAYCEDDFCSNECAKNWVTE